MKRREEQAEGKSGRAAVDHELQQRCPLLFDHLTASVFEDDGKARQTSTLNIFAQDSCWKAFLRDREAGEFLAVSAASFGEAIDLLEASLSDGMGGWRKDRYAQEQPGSGKTKNPAGQAKK